MDWSFDGNNSGGSQWPHANVDHPPGRGRKSQIGARLSEFEVTAQLCCGRSPGRCFPPSVPGVLRSLVQVWEEYSHGLLNDGALDSRFVPPTTHPQ